MGLLCQLKSEKEASKRAVLYSAISALISTLDIVDEHKRGTFQCTISLLYNEMVGCVMFFSDFHKKLGPNTSSPMHSASYFTQHLVILGEFCRVEYSRAGING